MNIESVTRVTRIVCYVSTDEGQYRRLSENEWEKIVDDEWVEIDSQTKVKELEIALGNHWGNVTFAGVV